MNTATLIGNLTDDPDLRYTPSGTPVAKMTVAVNRRVRKDNHWTDTTDGFFDVVAWRGLAEHATSSLTKGARVVVTGRLEQRTYDDNNGVRRSAVQLVADGLAPDLRFADAQVTKATPASTNSGDDNADEPVPF